MANIAETRFELNVGSDIEPEIIVPDTGSYTNPTSEMNSSTNIAATVFMVLAIVMAVFSIVIHIVCKKLNKKSRKFTLNHKKLNLARSTSVVLFLLSLGLFGKIVVVDQYFAHALNNNVDVALASTSNITINMDKNNPAVSCSKVNVILTKPQQSGYTFNTYKLYMYATELKDEKGNIIGTISADENELTANTWGYKLTGENTINYHKIPNTNTLVKTGSWNNDGEEVQIDFCVNLSAEAIEGKYTSTISFSATSERQEVVEPVTSYTVTINSNNNNYGTVSPNQLIVLEGTTVSVGSNKTFTLNGTTVTATPKNDYDFSSWTNNCGNEVTSNCTITANFNAKPVASYTVTWDANGGSVSPTSTTKNAGEQIGTLPIPTRDGYNFLGWFTVVDGGTQIDNTITVISDVTYYAHWEEVDICVGYQKMQDIANIKNSLEEEVHTQLCDNRDGKIYWVAKLKDGNVWMTQNLDYDIKATNNEVAKIGGTTDIWSPNTATSTSVFKDLSPEGTYSYDPGNVYLPNGVDFEAELECDVDFNGGENCHHHVGNYYQWNAAVAGTGRTFTNVDANASICPKGWRLPKANSITDNYSFGKLITAYNMPAISPDQPEAPKLWVSPFWFVMAGYVDYGTVEDRYSEGRVWSSSADSSVYDAYSFVFYGSYINSSLDCSRGFGFNVRCVAE